VRPYSAKTARLKRAMKAQEDAFKLEFNKCGLCGLIGMWAFGEPLMQLHHLVGGPLRSTLGNRRENWLMICNRCHWQAHNGAKNMPLIKPGNLLWVKQQVDPAYFDLSVITWLLRGDRGGLPDEWELAEPDEFYRRTA
jgi:hypothetical protein